jgi:hypothetical protein
VEIERDHCYSTHTLGCLLLLTPPAIITGKEAAVLHIAFSLRLPPRPMARSEYLSAAIARTDIASVGVDGTPPQ